MAAPLLDSGLKSVASSADHPGMTVLATGDGADRRVNDLLRFDPVGRCLIFGVASRSISVQGGNVAVLEAYVDLVGDLRRERPTSLVDVRAADLDALCEALDLDADDLREQLRSVLGLSPVVSRQLITRLRQRRVLRGVAASAAGIAVLGGLAAGASAPASAGEPPPRSAAVPAHAEDPEAPTVDGPLTVGPDGVGLIPPLEVDADGTMLIPAVQVDQVPGAGPGD
jgi:hypothetical protein